MGRQPFIKEYPSLLSGISDAITAGNAPLLQRSAHTLKGLVSNFGAFAVGDLALKLGLMGEKGAFTEAKGLLDLLEEETIRLRRELDVFTKGSRL